MSAPDLDAWLASPAVRTRHRRVAGVEPGALWEAAQAVRLRDTRTLGRIVRWRIPGTPRESTFRDLFRTHPFTVLEEDDRCSVSGLVGRIWTLERDYPRIEGPEAFAAWDRTGTVRVLMAHWVEPDARGSALVSETRVEPIGRGAALRLRALWATVGRFERLIGGEALAAAVRRAAQ
jgi:hypothetical protein